MKVFFTAFFCMFIKSRVYFHCVAPQEKKAFFIFSFFKPFKLSAIFLSTNMEENFFLFDDCRGAKKKIVVRSMANS